MALYADSTRSLKSAVMGVPAAFRMSLRLLAWGKLLVLTAAAVSVVSIIGCGSSSSTTTPPPVTLPPLSNVLVLPSGSTATSQTGSLPAATTSSTPTVLFGGKSAASINVAPTDQLPLEVDTPAAATDILVGVSGQTGYYDFPVSGAGTMNQIALNIPSGLTGGPYALMIQTRNASGVSPASSPITLNVTGQGQADTLPAPYTR